MRDHQSVEGLLCLAYIGQIRKIIHAANGREVHLAGVTNLKIDWYCEETNEV